MILSSSPPYIIIIIYISYFTFVPTKGDTHIHTKHTHEREERSRRETALKQDRLFQSMSRSQNTAASNKKRNNQQAILV